MFGYVTAYKSELKIREYEAYKSIYCGLCKQLKKSCGAFSRLHLSYDMTFMALVGIAANKTECTRIDGRCMLNPFCRKGYISDNQSIKLTAYTSVLLVYYKLLDDIADEGFFCALKARLALIFYKRMKNKAAAQLPKLDAFISEQLKKLSEQQKNGLLSLDGYADIFAQILAKAFEMLSDDNKTRRILYNLGYNIGKWVYVLDAAADIERDYEQKTFNAILASHPMQKDEDVKAYKKRLESFLVLYFSDVANMIKAACELIDYSSCRGIIENIISLGMPNKANTVIKGIKAENGVSNIL